MKHTEAIDFSDFEKLLRFSDVEVAVDELEPIGSGFSSSAYQTGRHVVKVLKSTYHTRSEAEEYVDILYGEQQRIEHYMGTASIVAAKFIVDECVEDQHRIVLVQDRIEGMTIFEALDLGADPKIFSRYFSRGISMYRNTGVIPDLACIENRFNPLIDTNTKVDMNGSYPRPVLVDTTLGRTQRKPLLGNVINSGIAFGVRRALKSVN